MKRIYFIFLIGVLFACCNRPVKNNTHLLNSIKKPIYNGRTRFKSWLNDTSNKISYSHHLRIIVGDTAEEKLINGVVKYYLNSDSTLFEIDRKYKLLIKKSDKYIPTDSDIDVIWSLLDEYNEIPKNSFFLVFDSEISYSESTIKRLNHYCDYYFNNIEITIPHNNYKAIYFYSKGRLTEKNEFFTKKKCNKCDIVTEEKDWDFIYDGKKTIKKLN